MRAIYIYPQHTQLAVKRNHANTQSVIHMCSWFNHGYNQELFFSTKLIFTAKFNMPDVILHGTYICNLHTVISMQRNAHAKASKGGFPVLARSLSQVAASACI
jgi:hypothetical protein